MRIILSGLVFLFSFSISAKVLKPNVIVLGFISEVTYQGFAKAISVSKDKKISILINSGGGYLDISLDIINLMKNAKREGFSFECSALRVDSAAASIFVECNKRIVYKNSSFGQHRAGLRSGACDWLCTVLDRARLSSEAKLLGQSVLKLRSGLPKLGKPLRRHRGKAILDYGLATEYRNKDISIKIIKKKK